MIRRASAQLVRARLAEYPAVALVGPRQCGKTTLARKLSGFYFDLEQERDRVRLDLQWDALVQGKKLVVLDEAQAWPEVFARLRGTIDESRKRKGRFLLLGSVAPSLMRSVSESLAGRLALVELTPFNVEEVGTARLDALWRYGGFPDGGVIKPSAFSTWQRNYVDLMVQRDLPAWGLSAKPATTMRLFKMLANLQGTMFNASRLGQSLGISYHTVQSYLEYLEGAYLVRSLPPFEANLGKRLVKSPRIYVRDTGILHTLLDFESSDELADKPWVGASWEGFVIEQILSVRRARGETLEAYFFRTQDGHEIDLVLQSANEREVIEIKLTSTPSLEDFTKLDTLGKKLGATRSVLLSRTRTTHSEGRRWSVDLAAYLEATRPVRRAASRKKPLK
jgi:predicted AAA+ superfamily ATPase